MTTEDPPNRGDVARLAAGFTTRPHVFQVLVLGSWVSRTGRKKIGHMDTAKPNKIDVVSIKELLEEGQVVPFDLLVKVSQEMVSGELPSDSLIHLQNAIEKALGKDVPSGYLIVDLGTGRKWLTSRLFILTGVSLRKVVGVRVGLHRTFGTRKSDALLMWYVLLSLGEKQLGGDRVFHVSRWPHRSAARTTQQEMD